MKVNRTMCATCPWRDDSPYEYLRADLEASAASRCSRICHSTGTNAINDATGKPAKICRGARDFQLRFLCGIGLLSEPTDEAWNAKCREMGIAPNRFTVEGVD